MNQKRGFTLIELLVVIAVIGILSAVVLASLNTARVRGKDAAMQSDFKNLQNQAEIFYSSSSVKYGPRASGASGCTTAGTVFTDPTVTAMIADISGNSPGNVVCRTSGGSVTAADTYVIFAPLASVSTDDWCVDSTGLSEEITKPSTPYTVVKCP